MHCRKAKKELSRYLAGECRSFEAAALAEHMSCCRSCGAELEELRRLNRLLDLWESGQAPGGLWESVMAEISRTGATSWTRERDDGVPVQKRFKPPRACVHLELLLRDLAVAAAVSLLLFWNAGAWLGGGKMLTTGKSVTGAVAAYSRVADTAVERFTETTGEYTRKIFFKE